MSTPAAGGTAAAHTRSTSLTRNSSNKPPSRPSTPLRPSSRTSLRDSQSYTPRAGYPYGGHSSSSGANTGGPGGGSNTATFPLEGLEPAFAELADSMADLEANMMHMQLMHESLARFNEGFGAFLYGLSVNAFCVDFPEQPLPQSFSRSNAAAAQHMPSWPGSALRPNPNSSSSSAANMTSSVDDTFLTNETSFITTNPPSWRIPTMYSHFGGGGGGGGSGSSSSGRARGGGAVGQRGGTGRAGVSRGAAATRGSSGAASTAGGRGLGLGPRGSGRGGQRGANTIPGAGTGSREGRGTATGRGYR